MIATFINLVLSSYLGGTAHAQSPNPAMDYWRASARRNFLEGFCVGQSLASQQIMLQPGQVISQSTIDALKAAIVTCKSQNAAPASAPAQPPSSGTSGPNGPVPQPTQKPTNLSPHA